MGQTPPPWHGQAVATQLLFDHEWQEFEVHRLRMEFSEEMLEVGRFQWKKVAHLFELIAKAKAILRQNPGCVLFYPPASAKWIPFLRDVVFLASVRPLAGASVFIFHASGLPEFVRKGLLRRIAGRLAYGRPDVSLEVAIEALPPHEVFAARQSSWCPCAIEVPDLHRAPRDPKSPLRILFIGSLQEGKGVIEILKTASLLNARGREKEFRFQIVGKWFSNKFETEARQLWTEWNLESMVEFAGQLTGDAKWKAYGEADVFFFPSHYASEATPIVLMEALGAGLPILSTRWAGIPAMLEGCSTATLLPVRSPESYADALTQLHQHRLAAESWAEVSREFYRKHFLPDRFIERVANAFRQATETIKTSDEKPTSPEPRPSDSPPLSLSVYLADQNPGYDRSFGISRMSQVVLEALGIQRGITIETIASKTSQQAQTGLGPMRILPWGTRSKSIRLLTDHFHPLFSRGDFHPDIHYFPKGYLPLLSGLCRPSVVTIHDTIIQYDEDHYPEWRQPWEYAYWAMMLKHTLREADRILAVSESSKAQILAFMNRHRIATKEITVTYEPCMYEYVPQPEMPTKENYVIHLASCEPHKRTAHLIRWWHEEESKGRNLPMLHLIGSVPSEVQSLLASSHSIVKSPFLEEAGLQAAYRSARALILPSEVEGFGLPALEAYYLGTPVCFVRGTSVEEILGGVTSQGGFSLDSSESLFTALDEVMAMSQDQVRACGLKLRETYAAQKVANRMLEVFEEVRGKGKH
jgi:glycosyltransferase involved in cell wall biosynthesis